MPKKYKTKDKLVQEMVKCRLADLEELFSEQPRAWRINRFQKRRVRAFEELIAGYGDQGREELKTLLTHDNNAVRVMAAGYLLRHCTAQARAVLEEVKNLKQGWCSFEAEQCLERWEEGEWQLDPDPEE